MFSHDVEMNTKGILHLHLHLNCQIAQPNIIVDRALYVGYDQIKQCEFSWAQ